MPRTVHNLSKNPASHLHIFVDASMAAMAAVSYLRITDSQTGHQQTSFLMGKCEVAPIKQKKLAKNGTRIRCYRSAPSTADPKRNDTDIRPNFSLVRQSSSLGLDSLK